MAAEVDVPVRALADLNVVARSEFKLKPEQEVAVLAVLPTGYDKSLIYQMFVRVKDLELTSLHDFYGSLHLYNCRSLLGDSTFVLLHSCL